jgi:hypothetical protein
MADPTKLLLVEGIYDFHLLKNLLGQHNIEAVEHKRGIPLSDRKINIHPMETKAELGNNLDLYLPKGDIQQVGIVLDADNNVQGSYDSCYHHIAQHGEIVVREELPTTGHIIQLKRFNQPDIIVGIWLMPDNQQMGMLEHFASQLIPAEDMLWPLAQKTVAELPEKRFPLAPNDHTRKAELHTWLAWQKEPGKPMGIAVSFGYLQHTAPVAQNFLVWVRTLFGFPLT